MTYTISTETIEQVWNNRISVKKFSYSNDRSQGVAGVEYRGQEGYRFCSGIFGLLYIVEYRIQEGDRFRSGIFGLVRVSLMALAWMVLIHRQHR